MKFFVVISKVQELIEEVNSIFIFSGFIQSVINISNTTVVLKSRGKGRKMVCFQPENLCTEAFKWFTTLKILESFALLHKFASVITSVRSFSDKGMCRSFIAFYFVMIQCYSCCLLAIVIFPYAKLSKFVKSSFWQAQV